MFRSLEFRKTVATLGLVLVIACGSVPAAGAVPLAQAGGGEMVETTPVEVAPNWVERLWTAIVDLIAAWGEDNTNNKDEGPLIDPDGAR